MQFSLWQVLVLAVVQGITEFLPISSDGHLVVIAPLLFGGHTAPPGMIGLTIVLHLGTLASILVYFRQRIARLFGEDRRTIGLLIVGTLPAVIIGLTIKLFFGWILDSTLLAGFMLPVTGVAVIWASRRTPGDTEYRDLTWKNCLLIGVCQAAAILPGLSRSGSTIAAGLSAGLSRSSAATYSFLLAIPAIAGAGVLEGLSLLSDRGSALDIQPSFLVIGAVVSFGVGLVALSALDRMLQGGRFHWFGWYCIALGLVVIGWQLSI